MNPMTQRKRQHTIQLDERSEAVLHHLIEEWNSNQSEVIRDLLKEKGTILVSKGEKINGF